MSNPGASAPDFYSQFGEDVLLDRIFGQKKSGVCVEVGANDGVLFSNTLHFEQLSWTCILVEPNPALCERLRRQRPVSRLYECAASSEPGQVTLLLADGAEDLSTVAQDQDHIQRIGREGGQIREVTVAARTLDDILEDAGADRIDFITIDVECYEMVVLQGFSIERWKPEVVIVEDNSSLRDKSVERWMERRGYRMFNFTGCNMWFARAENGRLLNLSSLLRLSLIRLKKRVAPLLPDGVRNALRPLKQRAGL